MATPTPQRDEGMAWLARQLRWERSLDSLRLGTSERVDTVETPEPERKAA